MPNAFILCVSKIRAGDNAQTAHPLGNNSNCPLPPNKGTYLYLATPYLSLYTHPYFFQFSHLLFYTSNSIFVTYSNHSWLFSSTQPIITFNSPPSTTVSSNSFSIILQIVCCNSFRAERQIKSYSNSTR